MRCLQKLRRMLWIPWLPRFSPDPHKIGEGKTGTYSNKRAISAERMILQTVQLGKAKVTLDLRRRRRFSYRQKRHRSESRHLRNAFLIRISRLNEVRTAFEQMKFKPTNDKNVDSFTEVILHDVKHRSVYLNKYTPYIQVSPI